MVLKKLLVAFDGSPNAQRAFEFAVDQVKKSCEGGEVHVISVVQPPEPAEGVMADIEPIVQSGKNYYEGLFSKLQEISSGEGVQLVTEVRVGYPADQIIQYVLEKKCDMVVIGRLGKSRIKRWLSGSVAKQVSFHATCVVAIVP